MFEANPPLCIPEGAGEDFGGCQWNLKNTIKKEHAMKKQVALFSALLFVAFTVGMLLPVSPQSNAVAAQCVTGHCYVHHAGNDDYRCGKGIGYNEIWSRHLSNSPTACCGDYLGYVCDPIAEPEPLIISD